jgi:putative nucleotidyltransferase with HDIG domain
VNILMVEDDLTSALILREALESEGHTVTEASTGAEAWSLYQVAGRARPEVVISDWMMPDMDGLDLCRLIRRAQAEQDGDGGNYTYVIMLTAKGERQDRLEALKAGVDDFLVKPLDPDELAARLSVARRILGMQADLRDRSARLQKLHGELERQNTELARSVQMIETANAQLETRVQERTRELASSNKALQTEVAERIDAQGRMQRQYERVEALRSIDAVITASLDLRFTLNFFLGRVTSLLGVEAASVMVNNPHTGLLETAAHTGFRAAFSPAVLPMAEQAAQSRKLVRTDDLAATLAQAPTLSGENYAGVEGFTGYIALPLIAKGQLNGVWQLFHRSPLPSDAEWIETAEALAGQAAIAIENTTLFEELQRSNRELMLAYDATIVGWSRALDLRDKETEGHTQRVTEMAVRLARAMGVPESEIVHVRRGALLHDIGKMGAPDSILLKPGTLTDEEWEVMRKHPDYAVQMLSPIAFLRPALDIPYCHHEKWDGTGYPRGLKGEEIPLAARLFAIVDVWDALSSDRPYRAGWPPERVLAHLASLSGTHFDPAVVKAFFALLSCEHGAQAQPGSATELRKAA